MIVEISSVFESREHDGSWTVFWNRSFLAFKSPRLSDWISSQIFKLWSWSFFSKCAKFYVDFENARKVWQKVFSFGGNVVWTCCLNLSELWGEYMRLAVNVLASRSKISDRPKKRCFLTQFGPAWWKSRVKLQPWKLQQCLQAVNTLIPERCSETEGFGHSSNYIFRSQWLLKYLSYEAHLFFQKAQNFI